MQWLDYNTPMGIGQLIKEVRQRKGWSLKKLQLKTGVDASTIHRIEAGTSEGRAASIARLIEALGIDPVEAQAAMRSRSTAPARKPIQDISDAEWELIQKVGVDPYIPSPIKGIIESIVREEYRRIRAGLPPSEGDDGPMEEDKES